MRYRAVSWWLTFEDLTWPNPELMDKIRRRADSCAANGVNCCIIYGAHLRWDFMPIWDRLHDLIRFIAGELHQRQILLFDHHSSVVTQRPRDQKEALNIWRTNRHHLPFYPSIKAAATWQFNGSYLNDWRMIDIETGQPVYLPAYNAEQFCMNNPAFQEAYVKYVAQLRDETGIDGLESDDGIFYAGWRACACTHCRELFKNDYGHALPKVGDTSFWGNRKSAAFRDWIAMRFQTSGDFLGRVKQALPPGFPLLTCCSNSDGYALPALGMSYQNFIQNCNHVMLEMVGSTPTPAGNWDDRIPGQLLQTAIARDHQAPCFGLGYGFFPDTAFFIWAVNKFLGSDCWLSSIKGRLNATPGELAALSDDPELVGEGYRWEKAHLQLFAGEVDTNVAVLFSRATRDFYGQVAGDYVADYHASCLELMRAGISCEVVTEIPEFNKTRWLVLSSVTCLSADERTRLSRFLKAGGTVIATGPTGHRDQRANLVAKEWLAQFGISARISEPARAGAFPPYSHLKEPVPIAQCSVPDSFLSQLHDGWFTASVGKGRLLWRPERITRHGVAAAVAEKLRSQADATVIVKGLPAGWRVRPYRDTNRVIIHALPGQVETVLHPTLKNTQGSDRIVEKLRFTPLSGEVKLESGTVLKNVVLHSPDLLESRAGRRNENKTWSVDLTNVSRYFVLECLA